MAEVYPEGGARTGDGRTTRTEGMGVRERMVCGGVPGSPEGYSHLVGYADGRSLGARILRAKKKVYAVIWGVCALCP